MSDDRIVSLGDLPAALAPSGSDSFAVCQNPAGCSPTDLLAQMTLDQVSQFVLDQVPTPLYRSRIIPAAQQVPLQNNAVVTLAQIDIPAGEWLITGEVWFDLLSGNAANVNRLVAAIAPSAAQPTDPADGSAVTSASISNIGTGLVLPFGWVYFQTDVTVPYFLTVMASWTTNITMAAYGKIAGLYRA